MIRENVAKAVVRYSSHESLQLNFRKSHGFCESMRRGKLLCQRRFEAEMFNHIIEELGKAGFEHYEISNFSKPGFESRHNLKCTGTMREYFGIEPEHLVKCQWSSLQESWSHPSHISRGG